MQHTKRPWWHDKDRVAICYRLPEDSSDRYGEDDDGVRNVVDLTSAMGGTDTTADALLIAASPDLLMWLKAICGRMRDNAEHLSETELTELDLAEAVIAQAEGRS